ncbi:hypothetical protein Pelo_15725 [Pelomyxa schiedti]|nr:hypothetical protein Pelo_15725 [Pelomyxa schiedti]
MGATPSSPVTSPRRARLTRTHHRSETSGRSRGRARSHSVTADIPGTGTRRASLFTISRSCEGTAQPSGGAGALLPGGHVAPARPASSLSRHAEGSDCSLSPRADFDDSSTPSSSSPSPTPNSASGASTPTATLGTTPPTATPPPPPLEPPPPLSPEKREAAAQALSLANLLWTVVLPRSLPRWCSYFPCGPNASSDSRHIRALQHSRAIIFGCEVPAESTSELMEDAAALGDSQSLAQVICDAWSGAAKQWPSVASPAVTRYPNTASFEVDPTAALLINLAEALFPLVPLVCKSLAFLADLNVQSVDPRNELGGSDALVAVARLGSRRGTNWILRNRRSWCKPGAYENIFLSACSAGNWDICRSIWNIVHSHSKFGLADKSILYAVANGHVEVAEKLVKMLRNPLSPEPLMLQLSCSGGHTETVQWLCKQVNFRRLPDVNFVAAKSMQACCAHGHLDLAKWIANEFALRREHIAGPIMNSSLAWACRYGHIRVCRWLLREFKISTAEVVESSAIEACCEGGHIEILDWAQTHLDMAAIPDSTKVDALLMCCTTGNLAVAKWLYTTFGPQPFNPTGQFLQESCGAGHLELTKWLMEVFPVPIDVAQECLKFACQRQHTALARHLYQQFTFLDPLSSFSLSCVELGSAAFAQWALQVSPVEFDADEAATERLFSECCGRGHLALARWLWREQLRDLPDFSAEAPALAARLVVQLCSSSQLLPTAAWLCAEFGVAATPEVEQAFVDSCGNYNFFGAWWLYVTFKFAPDSPTFRKALEKCPGSKMNIFLKRLAGV